MKIQDFKKGWLIGNFEPSLFKSDDVEIGIKNYVKGTIEEKHHHKLTTEYTIIISGKVKMLDKEFIAGDIIKIEPNIENEFHCLEDACVLVIKTPSIPSDKHY